MRRIRPLLSVAPAVILAIAAAAAFEDGADQAVWVGLGLAAVGVLAGVAATLWVVQGLVGDLRSAIEAVAEGRPVAPVSARTLGPLAPLASALNRLVDTLRSAQEAATVDRLTRVASRPALLDRLMAEVDRATRYERPLTIAFIDIDHFKAINDSHGHDAGDIVLRGVAAVFRDHLRAADLVGRYGGEEFMLVLPETAADEATEVTEKLRLLVQKERFAIGDGVDVGATVSIGIAGGRGPNLKTDELIRDADAAMYSAKSLGRNQTFVFAEPNDDDRIPRAPISAEGRARATEVGEAARHAAEAVLAAVINPLPHYRGKPSPVIASIAVRMATTLGLPPAEVERVRVAALLHDIGKVAVPADILDKPGPLSPAEWQTVVQHPRIGQVIIDQVAAVQDAGKIILHHHERFAGHGYPHGLRGSDIPIGARIVAIADAYDAMIQDRPYKGRISHPAAIAELRAHAGRQFDPQLVALFCDLFGSEAPAPDPSLLIGQPHPAARPSRGARRAAGA
ncbi:MAG TPA: diguanylate cyclase [Candidatus Limnocylindrales bacterium]|nr:diguanylate cyclase [Candidatus Limnocylindrales bacterium]